MRKEILYLVLILLMASSALGATIHGTIYDMNLNKVSGAIVEINSTPRQRLASVDGTYSFSLQKGNYAIIAVYNEKNNIQKSEEKLSITDEGDYVLDLFLFPDISGEETLFNESDINISQPYKRDYTPYTVIGLLLVLGLAGFIIYLKYFREKRIEEKIERKEDTDLNKVILILKKHGGRATQKDIRKEIPLSEAKISLMIAELESDNRIKKIKKGRGNIIVLQ